MIIENNSLFGVYVEKLFPNKIIAREVPTIIVDPTVYSVDLEMALVKRGYMVIFVKENVEEYINDHPNTLLLTADLDSTLKITREKWFLVNHPEALEGNIQIIDNYVLGLIRRRYG